MKISLNGEQHTCSVTTLAELLASLPNANQAFAAAVNGQFVPKNLYADTQLNDGDNIDIVAPMQGG